MALPDVAFEWVDSAERLRELCRGWLSDPVLAVDTEFMRSATYYPIVGLVQVANATGIWLLDPQACADLAPLADVMAAPGVLKVLYSASEDLEVFQRCLGTLPRPLFDAQLALALLGLGAQPGYSTAVRELQQVELPKEETRSDWLQRPLSEGQLRYAALDVFFLYRMYFQLEERLRARGRYPWVMEDSARLLERVASTAPEGQAWLRINGRNRLDRRRSGALQLLAAWREAEARRQDKPRSRVCRDSQLLDIARTLPRDAADLQRLPEMTPGFVRRRSDELLALVQQALAMPGDHLPQPEEPPLPREARVIVDRLRDCLQAIADRLEVTPEVLARKRDLVELVQSGFEQGNYRLPPGLGGWREATVGRYLLDFLEG